MPAYPVTIQGNREGIAEPFHNVAAGFDHVGRRNDGRERANVADANIVGVRATGVCSDALFAATALIDAPIGPDQEVIPDVTPAVGVHMVRLNGAQSLRDAHGVGGR